MNLFLVTILDTYNSHQFIIAATDYASAYRQYTGRFVAETNKHLSFLFEFRRDRNLPLPDATEILESFKLDFQIEPINLVNGTVINANYDKITEEISFEIL